MESSNDEERLLSLIRLVLPKGNLSELELAPDSDLASLGLDSLSTVQLILSIEESFDVALPDEAVSFDNFRTPRTILAAIAASRGNLS